MKFHISPQIFEKFPGLTVGVVVAKNVDNAGTAEEIQNRLRAIESAIRAKYNEESLSQDPKIDVWRKAYLTFGVKPKKARSSVESLYSLVLCGVNLRPINKLVDIYNLISLKHMLTAGGEDTDKMQGDLTLTFAGENEPPVLVLGDSELKPPHAGEVIYKDDISTICRRWNWREADRTKLTEETRNCILVIEGLPPVTRQEVETATAELKDLISQFCGGDVSYAMLDQGKSEIEI